MRRVLFRRHSGYPRDVSKTIGDRFPPATGDGGAGSEKGRDPDGALHSMNALKPQFLISFKRFDHPRDIM
ncbi:MAG: hypothetical protein DRH56_00065 [Deltaproteobacteria bacterium]|nr:MAG: hypothetical protein DRH56_00065 [Deltaproteobacteria bacterium]